MLEAIGVTIAYPSCAPVLAGHSLQVQPGERLGLSGPSGCGKTTLGLVLAGYLKPQRGQVLVDGKPLPARGHCPVQLVPQHPELAVNPRWKLRDILAESRPEDCLATAFGVDPGWLDRYPVELSGGELQRVVLTRALAAGTRYLVCDEISAMLDPLTQARLWRALIEEAERRSVGLLVISHDPALLQAVCHRVIPFGDLACALDAPPSP